VDDVIRLLDFNANLALQVKTGQLETIEVSPGKFRLVPRSQPT
jgi:hypothetical protein